MKRYQSLLGLGAIALAVTTPFLFSEPVMAQLQRVTQTVTETLQREPQIRLNLSAEKQITTVDEQGNPVTNWQQLGTQVVAQPGDVLRFTMHGENTSDRDVRNLVVTQPVPNAMKYVLGSATVNQVTGAEVTYSIDGGQTFGVNPTVDVEQADGSIVTRPAPAESYTHIRWNFPDAVSAGTGIHATYQATVE